MKGVSMGKIEFIKSQIHEGVENIDDEDFLLAVQEVIQKKYLPPDKPLLAKWQRQRIEESKKQIERGEYLTNEEVEEMMRRWLNE